jgi:hypothetical protein
MHTLQSQARSNIMWARIKQFFASMTHQSSMDWWEEQYLNAAQNVADLEYRQRRLSQGFSRSKGY